MVKKKIKIIIDTDPGVDDSAANIVAMFEDKLDILLFTTVSGNKDIETCTRNMLYLVESFGMDIPVAKGEGSPLYRESKDASFIHQQTGLGNHIPKEPKIRKITQNHAVDEMYLKLKESYDKGEKVKLLLLGPQTNAAILLDKYPGCEKMIDEIVFMGGTPWGQKGVTPHVSFNLSSDPEAFRRLLFANVSLVMTPSLLRRTLHLNEAQVFAMQKYGKAGKMLYEMYSGYWEPGEKQKWCALNDITALFYILHKSLFKTKMADIDVDTNDNPGKTVFTYRKGGRVKVITKVYEKRFIKTLFKHLKKIEKIVG